MGCGAAALAGIAGEAERATGGWAGRSDQMATTTVVTSAVTTTRAIPIAVSFQGFQSLFMSSPA